MREDSLGSRASVVFPVIWCHAGRLEGRGVIALLLTIGLICPLSAADPELTFFAWSDQHVKVDGDGEHLKPATDAMNQLPGRAFPRKIGGTVAKPAFVFGCGDITEWPTHAAMTTYDRLVNERLAYPARDVIGNHDEGGKMPSETIKKWLIRRHGSLTYRFEANGVEFICLYSKYDENLNSPSQPLSTESLEQLSDHLREVSEDTPTIIATHLCFDAITNKDALLDMLESYNVLAILGGHYHKAKVDRYRGRAFVQLPSPADGSPDEIMVIRISRDRIVALPYDYRSRTWSTEHRKMLDAHWRRPAQHRVPSR